MEAVRDFTSQRQGDALGLTVFGNAVLHWLPLTQDLDSLSNAEPFVAPGRLASDRFGGTAVANALRACREHLLDREDGDRVLILISDGESKDLQNGGAELVGRQLRAADIVTYVIHVADYEVPVTSRIVAESTGGRAFAAGDPAGLKAVFRRIDAMQPIRYENAGQKRVRDYGCLGVVGLVVGLLFVAHSIGLRNTPW